VCIHGAKALTALVCVRQYDLRIVRDGIYYACGVTLVGLVLSNFVTPWLGIPFYLLAAFCLYFFRDPERAAPAGDVMVSPADGRVVSIREISPDRTRISIFLNVFNVHVNRAPVAGTIVDIKYQPGTFKVASLEAASAENEQNTFTVDDGRSRVVFTQIAGLIARRIICYKRTGDQVMTGERIGLIKFGSRMDVFFGPEWTLSVKSGEKVSAGVTVLAERKAVGSAA
jgi:phosphatidylserine decarboxylase